jgi:hypothetical protein
MKKVLDLGLDVVDKSFHIGAFCKKTGEIFEMTLKSNIGNLMRKLENFIEQDF